MPEFSPSQLSQEWKSGVYRPAYYLCGEESFSRKAALSFIKKNADSFNFREFSKVTALAKTSEIISELLSLPVFSERRFVIVEIPDAGAVLKKALLEYLKSPLVSSVLILHSDEPKPDLRDSLFHEISRQGAVCVFPKLKENEAVSQALKLINKSGKNISREACELLVREVGADWGLLSQEIEKLCLFAEGPEVSLKEVSLSLGYRKESDPFLLPRLIEKRDKKAVLTHLYFFLNEGKTQDQAFRALSQISAVIVKQLKAKVMLASGLQKSMIEKNLRLHPYWDKGFFENLASVNEEKLKKNLMSCLETEMKLKSQSWLSPQVEIEILASELCKN